MLIDTLVSFVTSGTQEISKLGPGGAPTAALIARRIFSPGSSAGTGRYYSTRPAGTSRCGHQRRWSQSEVWCAMSTFRAEPPACALHQIQHHGEARRSDECMMRIGGPRPNGSRCRQWHRRRAGVVMKPTPREQAPATRYAPYCHGSRRNRSGSGSSLTSGDDGGTQHHGGTPLTSEASWCPARSR